MVNEVLMGAFVDEMEKLSMAAIALGRRPEDKEHWYKDPDRKYTHLETRVTQRLGVPDEGPKRQLARVSRTTLNDRLTALAKVLQQHEDLRGGKRDGTHYYLGGGPLYMDVVDPEDNKYLGSFALSDMMQDSDPHRRMPAHRIDTFYGPDMPKPKGQDIMQVFSGPKNKKARRAIRKALSDFVEGLKNDQAAIAAQAVARAAARAAKR